MSNVFSCKCQVLSHFLPTTVLQISVILKFVAIFFWFDCLLFLLVRLEGIGNQIRSSVEMRLIKKERIPVIRSLRTIINK